MTVTGPDILACRSSTPTAQPGPTARRVGRPLRCLRPARSGRGSVVGVVRHGVHVGAGEPERGGEAEHPGGVGAPEHDQGRVDAEVGDRPPGLPLTTSGTPARSTEVAVSPSPTVTVVAVMSDTVPETTAGAVLNAVTDAASMRPPGRRVAGRVTVIGLRRVTPPRVVTVAARTTMEDPVVDTTRPCAVKCWASGGPSGVSARGWGGVPVGVRGEGGGRCGREQQRRTGRGGSDHRCSGGAGRQHRNLRNGRPRPARQGMR